MLRGINQQQIFEDEEDYQKFVEVLKNYQAICGYTIYQSGDYQSGDGSMIEL